MSITKFKRKPSPRPTVAKIRELEFQLKESQELAQLLNVRLQGLPEGFIPQEGFESLFSILKEAHDQAAFGKGQERHGQGLPYGAQPMQTISFIMRGSQGILWQAIKKIQEANGKLDDARLNGDPEMIKLAKRFARRELLGAINYVAGALIYEDAHQ